MSAEKQFPIQASTGKPATRKFTVPWVMAERAYEQYARLFGHGQSMERIKERGGFGWSEFALLYCGKNPIVDHEVRMLSKCTQVVICDLLSYPEVIRG